MEQFLEPNTPSWDKTSLKKSYEALRKAQRQLRYISLEEEHFLKITSLYADYIRRQTNLEHILLPWQLHTILRPKWHRFQYAYNRAAAEYGRLSCNVLCQKLYNTLPLEVREMIYGELVGSGDYEIVPVQNFQNLYGRDENELMTSSNFVGPRHLDYGPIEHWWYEAYTGANVDREIAVVWYHTRTFRLTTVNQQYFPGFFMTDSTWKNIAPSQETRRVEYTVDRPTTDLEILFEIQNKNVELIISLVWNTWDQWGLFRLSPRRVWLLLKSVAPTVYRLRSAGYHRTRVQVHIREWEILSKKDITYMFDIPEEDFEATGLVCFVIFLVK